MKKLFYLSTCDTCRKIMAQIKIPEDVVIQDVKITNINLVELDFLQSAVGSYEALFNKRSRKYAALKSPGFVISEIQLRKMISEEYTFLKRPVLVYNKDVFVGNSRENVAKLIEKFGKK